MKNLLIIAVVFTTVLATAQTSKATSEKGITITVTVDNIKNNSGKMLFGLYTEDGFAKEQTFQSAASTIKGKKVVVTFTNIPKGTYAIKCLHDENDNGQMDFEASGMPKESYGTSNNQLSYGPPEFGPSKFTVKDTDLTFEIIL